MANEALSVTAVPCHLYPSGALRLREGGAARYLPTHFLTITKEEQPDMILVFLDPFSNDFPVVNLEIVKNDVDLPLNVLDLKWSPCQDHVRKFYRERFSTQF